MFLKLLAGVCLPVILAIAMPPNIEVPSGNVPYLKAAAVGTQNYVCLPSANGLAWTFQGPQATLFLSFKVFNMEVKRQVATHYLSPNEVEAGLGRATWQSSLDSSAVWAKKIQESSDPAFVAPNAIPWFLLEVVGTHTGPTQGTSFVATTYIQRVNTTGGVAPQGECTTPGSIQFVPYTADYVFYRKAQ